MIPHLLWAVKPRLERTLKSEPRVWDRYQKARSRYLERRSVQLLRSVSPHATGWTSLHYRRTGETTDDELDGLVLVDDVAFLIEAKSGSMSPAGRRGAPSVREDLTSLVGEAYAQLRRARQYILESDDVTFDADEGRLDLSGRRPAHLFLVSTTLEPLSVFVTRMAVVADDLRIELSDRLWSCSEFDLAVISELASGAGELVHYLRTRLAVAEREVDTSDELDWFGSYMANGLNFPSGGTSTYLLSQTTQFDNYFMPQVAGRPPGPRPFTRITEGARRKIEALESSGEPGFIRAVTRILNQQRGPTPT